MDYEKNNEALDIVKRMVADGQVSQEVAEKYFPELKESEDEKIRKALIFHFQGDGYLCNKVGNIPNTDIIAWLEKQGQTFTKKDVDDAYLKGVCDTKHEFEKQGEQKPHEDIVDEINRKAFPNHYGGCAVLDNEIPFGANDSEMVEATYIIPKVFHAEIDCDKVHIKKCEQNPADKVEPKFKVGNWYQCTKDFFGKGVTFDKNTAYYCAKEGCLQNEYGCHIAIVKDLYDNFKLWTIQDAKDGDVLVGADNIIIYGGYINNYGGRIGNKAILAYCGWNGEKLVINKKKKEGFGGIGYVPATKEQRDLLFAKMKEAGYEWDAEKKELKEIEPNPIIPKFKVGDVIKDTEDGEVFTIKTITKEKYIYTDGSFDWIKDQDVYELVEQKPVEWDDNDEYIFNTILHTLDLKKCKFEKEGNSEEAERWHTYYNWLKPIKNRMLPQPRQGWSEEDKRSIRDSIFYLKSAKKYFEKDDDILWDEKWFNLCIEFLEALYKKLQPQPQWKPSDEQIGALEHFVRSIAESGYASPHDNNTKLVYSLFNDLKKLREE